jgi:hypothetical protein
VIGSHGIAGSAGMEQNGLSNMSETAGEEIIIPNINALSNLPGKLVINPLNIGLSTLPPLS